MRSAHLARATFRDQGRAAAGAAARAAAAADRVGVAGSISAAVARAARTRIRDRSRTRSAARLLNAAPYQLRPDVAGDAATVRPEHLRRDFGGPLKIPGIYADTNRRTNFQLNYTGNESNNVFDQYATVPTDAERNGDFSCELHPVGRSRRPASRSPATRFRAEPHGSRGAGDSLGLHPAAERAGRGHRENYHVSTTAHSSSEAVSLRLTQNLSPTVTGRPGRVREVRRAAAAWWRWWRWRRGRGGHADARGTNIVLNAQLQYRRNETQALNVFPVWGADTTNTSSPRRSR